ncbi:MAG: hypothetical protein K0U98_00265 [Deltaproteobacteria bacterium]|nr:hypothetical protein [Deltaproteobacteria bacterium]
MRIRELWEVKNQVWVGMAAVLLLILGFGASFQAEAGYEIPVLSGGGGPWMNLTTFPGCEPGTLCAEWPEANGNTAVVCCIPENIPDLSSPTSCQTFLYRRPLV